MLLKISYFWPFFANFLVLDRKLIWMALFWAVTLNFWVAPSWLKTYFESIFSLFLDLTCLDWFSELRILCIYIFLEMSFALASPFYCLPIFGDRLLYQTSGKFQSRLLEASFLHFCLIPGSCIWPQKFSMLIPHFWDISNLVRLWCAYVILEFDISKDQVAFFFGLKNLHFGPIFGSKNLNSVSFFLWKLIFGPFSAHFWL